VQPTQEGAAQAESMKNQVAIDAAQAAGFTEEEMSQLSAQEQLEITQAAQAQAAEMEAKQNGKKSQAESQREAQQDILESAVSAAQQQEQM